MDNRTAEEVMSDADQTNKEVEDMLDAQAKDIDRRLAILEKKLGIKL